MMRRRSNIDGGMRESSTTETTSVKEENVEWEMRPGGMLVQKRSNKSGSLVPNLRVRVSFGATRYEIFVNSQATFGKIVTAFLFLIRNRNNARSSFNAFLLSCLFTLLLWCSGNVIKARCFVAGELKKLLTAETGLQASEQRLIFRGKERENGEYLDMSGVKDRSKVKLIDDPSSRERRLIEMRRNTKIQIASRAISDVSMEVDKLAEQASEPNLSIIIQ